MLNVLEQAIVAAKNCNWSLVNECLQQLPLGKKVTEGDAASPPLEDGDLEQVLSIALNVLDHGDFQERWDVAKLFPKLGKRAIAPLIEILEDEDADLELRWFAGRILGEFHHPSVVTSLVEMLRTSQDEELVEMATTTLANLGSSAIDALTALLTDSESRLLAVRSLSQIRHSYTVTPLLSVVNDELLQVRSAAIEALGSFHDSRIGPVLLEALNDLAAPVRKEAAIALGLRADLREELDLVNRLKPLLYDFNLEVCGAAAIALGRMGTNEAAAALFEVLKSPATPIPLQVALVRALSWMGTADALEYLRLALTMTHVEVCQEIVTLLGRMEKPDLRPKAAQILIEFLQYGHPAALQTSLKQALALALGQLGDSGAIQELIKLLADSDASVRLHAIAALKKLAPEDAHRQLQQLAESENITPELKEGVAIALQEWQLDK